MSWWVSLEGKDGEPVTIVSHAEGGTFVVGGSTEASLNVTYNYSKFYFAALDTEEGLRWLNGRCGLDCQAWLAQAIAELGIWRDEDYWSATVGNAGYALSVLRTWALEHPGAVFRVN